MSIFWYFVVCKGRDSNNAMIGMAFFAALDILCLVLLGLALNAG